VLPAAHIERTLRDYYAGKLGEEDFEERLLYNVDENRFRAICQNALEGLATKKLNLDMLVERRARAQERRVVPEAVFRFIASAAPYANLTIKPVGSQPYTFEPGRTPPALRQYEQHDSWHLSPLAERYPRCTTDRETAERHNLEWITPGHPLFEALRRHVLAQASGAFSQGACFYSLQHERPARVDLYRARVVDGLGQVIHERLFAVELPLGGEPVLREPSALLGNFTPAGTQMKPPLQDAFPEVAGWLHQNALQPFLQEVSAERLAEIERIKAHVELSLTELVQKADEEFGRAAYEVEQNVPGAEGRLAQAWNRCAELQARRERRREELACQRALTLQAVERITSVLVLPHPEREAPNLRNLRPDHETEMTAMQVVMDCERAQGRQVFDVHEQDLGYDLTSLDLRSGELRLIEAKGIGGPTGRVLLTPNERRVAEDRRDCYWLYIVTHCKTNPTLQEPVRDPARFSWHEVQKVDHYWLEVDALTQPMQLHDDGLAYDK